MAFTDLGSLGAIGSTANNQSLLNLTTSAAIAAGDFVVVVCAADNIANGGDDNAVANVALPGQALTKAVQIANALTAQAGASCSVWYGVALSSHASGVTIQANFGSVGALVDASAMTARKFSVGSTVSVEGTPGTLVNNTGADPGSLNVTTANIACLRVRGIASQVGNNTNLTPTSTWTAWANGNSATSGTTGEICARAEHLISTATGAASDPTYVSAIYASAYVAFREVTHYTMPANTGTIAVSGQTAVAGFGRTTAGGTGTLTAAGQAATLTWPSVRPALSLRQLNTQGTFNFGATAYAGTAPSGYQNWEEAPVIIRELAAGVGTLTLGGNVVRLAADRRLTAGTGTVALAGQAASLRSASRITAGIGTLTLAGQAANLRVVRSMTAGTGTLTLAGQVAGLRGTRLMTAGHGVLTAAGYDVVLTKSSTVTHYTMAAAYGAIALAGQAITFKRNHVVPFATGTLTLSGQATPLRSARKLAVTVGTLTLAGQVCALAYGRKLAAGLGTLTLVGQSVTARFTRRLVVTHGTLALSGWPAALISSFAPKVLTGDLGTLALAGQAVIFKRSHVFPVLTGTLTLGGQAVTLRDNRTLGAGPGTITLSGQAIGLRHGRQLAATHGTITLNGQAVNLPRSRTMPVVTGTIQFFGPVVNLINSGNPNKLLPAGVGVVRLSGQDITFRQISVLSAGTGVLTLTSQLIGPPFSRVLSVATGTLTIDGQPVALIHDETFAPVLTAGTGSIVLSAQLIDFRVARVTTPIAPSPPPSIRDYTWYDRRPSRPKRWQRR